ncbi:Histone-lysine N-methyltransferase SETMAR, partial [Habropoda laboriosa]
PNSLDPSSNDYHFFKHRNNFLTNKLFRNEDTVKAVFEESFHSKTRDFYKFEITKLVVNRWKKCVNYFHKIHYFYLKCHFKNTSFRMYLHELDTCCSLFCTRILFMEDFRIPRDFRGINETSNDSYRGNRVTLFQLISKRMDSIQTNCTNGEFIFNVSSPLGSLCKRVKERCCLTSLCTAIRKPRG